MSDYYSHRDPKGTHGARGAMDYDTGGSSSWIWALLVLVALVALIAIGSSGGVSDGAESGDLAVPAAPQSTQQIDQ